eukprot:scaffold6439_cov167-Amphora_coffeaeformis.AAC.15
MLRKGIDGQEDGSGRSVNESLLIASFQTRHNGGFMKMCQCTQVGWDRSSATFDCCHGTGGRFVQSCRVVGWIGMLRRCRGGKGGLLFQLNRDRLVFLVDHDRSIVVDRDPPGDPIIRYRRCRQGVLVVISAIFACPSSYDRCPRGQPIRTGTSQGSASTTRCSGSSRGCLCHATTTGGDFIHAMRSLYRSRSGMIIVILTGRDQGSFHPDRLKSSRMTALVRVVVVVVVVVDGSGGGDGSGGTGRHDDD